MQLKLGSNKRCGIIVDSQLEGILQYHGLEGNKLAISYTKYTTFSECDKPVKRTNPYEIKFRAHQLSYKLATPQSLPIPAKIPSQSLNFPSS